MTQIKFYIPIILILVLQVSCSPKKNDEKIERLEELGIEIFQFAQNGDYEAQLPEDLVFIGNSTFWKILEINEPANSVHINVHDATEDNDADYFLDIGTYIGLRIKYDDEIDKFHILGYQGTQTKGKESYLTQISDLDQNLYQMGDIKPEIGLNGMMINESTKKEIFNEFDEKLFGRLGIWFDFELDTLRSLYISRYQLKTKKGIRPETSYRSEILNEYGRPNKTTNNFTFLSKKINNIEVLIYNGIEFVILEDELMMIIVK